MKEKYIFFILLIVALGLLMSTKIGRVTKGTVSSEELAIESKLKRAAKRQLTAPEKIDIERIQNLVGFTSYEALVKRSPFFKAQPKQTKVAERKVEVLPVEEKTPKFLYKGKIVAGNRLVVIIEQPRSGEVFMVSKGESLDGYKVLDIADTEVILSKTGEENIVLKTIESP